MANKQLEKAKLLRRRHLRIRKKISGTTERPRMAVSRSHKHIQAQLVDDSTGRSLLGLSSNSKDVRERLADLSGKCDKGREVGKLLAAKAIEAGITQVVFDRGGYLYHGRVRALAEGAREGGLKF
jgi:large subunit ribosomal protein L18